MIKQQVEFVLMATKVTTHALVTTEKYDTLIGNAIVWFH